MKNYGLVSWLSICFLFGCDRPPVETAPPNVLFIAVDDLRPELGCYGRGHIHSPHIDALAKQGTLFSNAYCNIPVCGASRASILTGLRPTFTRFKNYFSRADEDAPGKITLPGLFKSNGYTTISNGKISHNADDSKKDWDEIWRVAGISPRDYLTAENIHLDTVKDQRGYPYEKIDVADSIYRDGKMTHKAIADLKRLKQQDNPFFLAVGYMKPHLPFNAPEKYWNLYDRAEIRLPDNRTMPDDVPRKALHTSGELRHYHGVPAEGPVSDSLARILIHGYYASVSYTDALIGQLLAALKKLELDKNTIVVLWGDHGWNLYEHGLWCKHCNYRTSLQVPLIWRLPNQEVGLIKKEMVEFVDIYPTLMDLCHLPDPGHLQGNSLKPLLNDEPMTAWKKTIESVWKDGFTYTTRTHAYTEWRSANDSIEARMMFDHLQDPEENINMVDEQGSARIIESILSTN